MIQKKLVLVGGCSFSENKGNIFNGKYDAHGDWIPWTDLATLELADSWDIHNTAQGSIGNPLISNKIMDFILKNKRKPDLVIIQWSAIGRAYSLNEKHFTKRVIEDVVNGGIEFAPHMGEYISQNGIEGWVTNAIAKISESFYQNSLVSMLGLQSFLQSQDIPYFTFWGWSQFDDELNQKFKPYLDELYNENWWKPYESMSEYIQDKYGKDGIMGNGDFHPNSMGQKYFYETIIKKLLPRLI